MTDDTVIYMDNGQSTRRNVHRFWASKKGRDLGDSKDLDKIIDAWMWTNDGYGKRGLIVVDTALGYTWGSFPGNEEGKKRMKCELGGHKIMSTYEDGDDLHILVWGDVKNPKSNYCQSVSSASRRPAAPRTAPRTTVRKVAKPKTTRAKTSSPRTVKTRSASVKRRR